MGLSQAQAKALLSAAQVFEGYEGGLDGFWIPRGACTEPARALSLRRDDRRAARGRVVHPGGAPRHGQDRDGVEHRAAHRHQPQQAAAVAVFSLEMSKESLMTRLICSRARVNQQRFRVGPPGPRRARG
jgi:replicative DNA helicase